MAITKYFDTSRNQHYHVLGYFSEISFKAFREVATAFAEETGVPLDSVIIDKIHHSRRFKNFAYLYSAAKGQTPLPGSKQLEDVFDWLED